MSESDWLAGKPVRISLIGYQSINAHITVGVVVGAIKKQAE